MQKKNDLILPIYLIFNILTILLGSYLVIKKVIDMCIFSKFYIILFIINTIILLIMVINKIIKKKKISWKLYDIFLLIIIIFGFISSCFAINKESAFFGFKDRYEGFLQLMYYFSIFMLSTLIDKKYKKYVVYSIIFCGLIECIYAIMQKKGMPVFIQYHNGSPWATGFITNPNFFGTFMLLCLSYAIGLFIDSTEKVIKILHCLLIVLFMTGLVISNTLSVFVGLFLVYIYILIYSIKNKKYADLILLTVILLSVTIIIHIAGYSHMFNDVIKTKDQVVEISKGHVEETYGSKRIFIWKNALRIVPEYLLHGAGVDNFYYAFGENPLKLGNKFYDKAHNEYLQILVCEGLFALISYLVFFSIIVINGIKNSFKNKELFLIIPIIGYLVQAFFNISVIEVAPFFYIALGLCINRGKNN